MLLAADASVGTARQRDDSPVALRLPIQHHVNSTDLSTFLQLTSLQPLQILLPEPVPYETPPSGKYVEAQSFTIVWSAVEVSDPKNHWIIIDYHLLLINIVNEEGQCFKQPQISFGGKLLFHYHHVNLFTARMRIWKMGNPPTLLQDRTFQYKLYRNLEHFTVEEQFIAATSYVDSDPEFVTLYFIYTETLEEHRSLSLMLNCKYVYRRGMLFQDRGNGIIRILDVATGTFFNNAHLPFRKEGELSVHYVWRRASSKFEC